MITPLILFSVGIDSRLSSVVMDEWALDGAHLYITPVTPTSQSSTMNKVSINIVSYHGDDISVTSSPRIHPGIVYHSVLLSCCQLVMSLCGYPPANQITGAVVPVIKCGMDHVMFVIVYVKLSCLHNTKLLRLIVVTLFRWFCGFVKQSSNHLVIVLLEILVIKLYSNFTATCRGIDN